MIEETYLSPSPMKPGRPIYLNIWEHLSLPLFFLTIFLLIGGFTFKTLELSYSDKYLSYYSLEVIYETGTRDSVVVRSFKPPHLTEDRNLVVYEKGKQHVIITGVRMINKLKN